MSIYKGLVTYNLSTETCAAIRHNEEAMSIV